MTSRELLEIKAGFEGPLWRLIKQRVETEVIEARAAAAKYRIESVGDLIVREQMIMKSNAIEEFIDSFPSQIHNEYKDQLEKENKENT